MDNIREKLVELLKERTGCTYGGSYGDVIIEEEIDISDEEIARIADQLIANGVTVQEWISVEDELPKEQGFYRVYHKNSKSICDRFYHKDCPDLFVNVRDDPITHWKPIEQPPKGE